MGAEGGPGGHGRDRTWGLTQSTRVFIRRSMLVLLNFVLPLFCISLVSGPAEEEEGLGKPNTEPASGLRPSPRLQDISVEERHRLDGQGACLQGCRVSTLFMEPALARLPLQPEAHLRR